MSQSIDFTGGRNFKVQFENKVEPEQVRELISSKFGDANVSVIAIGADGKTVRISTNYRIEEEGNNIDSEIEAYLYETLKPLLTQNITLETFIDRENHTGGSIISSQKVGPSIADDIKVSAIWSVVLALIAIGLYILLRFRNIAYSIGSVCALACDTIIILGAYSMFWGILPFSLEIDQTFIGAILTAIGYSINDKVVIFDRVREFFGLYPKRNKKVLFNDSLNTTLARTINRKRQTNQEFTEKQYEHIHFMMKLTDDALGQMIVVVERSDHQGIDVNKSFNIENEINNYRNQLKNQNILDVNNKEYDYQMGVYYMDIIAECEKLGDYVVNVVEASSDIKEKKAS